MNYDLEVLFILFSMENILDSYNITNKYSKISIYLIYEHNKINIKNNYYILNKYPNTLTNNKISRYNLTCDILNYFIFKQYSSMKLIFINNGFEWILHPKLIKYIKRYTIKNLKYKYIKNDFNLINHIYIMNGNKYKN